MTGGARPKLTGDIAIVGMGGRFPGSPDLGAFWRVIREGRVCAGPVPRDRWHHELFYSPNGAREHNKTYAQKMAAVEDIRSFAPEFFGLSPRRARVMDPQQRLFLEAVRIALEDAGYAHRPFPKKRTGVFAGTTVSDFMDIVALRARTWQVADGEFGRGLKLTPEQLQALSEDTVPMQAYTLVGSLLNMVAANVNQTFDFGGPSFTTDAACSSALVALNEAVLQLRAGLIDDAIVGGAYIILSPDNFICFSRIGALSPTDACRPYDGRADGFFIGEGVGAVVLRRLEDARRAGDRIYAVIKGIAANSDGKGEGPMTPRREGQLNALEDAYADAQVNPRTIGFLEGHGTATPVGDATEIAAFRDVLKNAGGPSHGCAVTSVKGNIGHSMSAAGIAGLIKAVLVMHHKTLPPQAGYGEARPELDLDGFGLHIPRERSAWNPSPDHPRRAGVNAFGFGGTNVHVVLEEPTQGASPSVTLAVPAGYPTSSAPAPLPAVAPPELFVLTAPTPALLAGHADDVRRALADLPGDTRLGDLARTFAYRRPEPARIAFVARDLKDLAEKLAIAAQVGRGETAVPTGVYFGAAPLAPRERSVAFMFAGQGAQSPGLAWDLYQRFPAFRAELQRLMGAVTDLPRPLIDYLYPAAWPDGNQADAASALTATEVCQPAVAAVSLAIAGFARALGIVPSLTLGHSLGEFAAAADAGLVDGPEADAAVVRFVALRGKLFAEATAGDPGTMAAVAGDEATVAAQLNGIPDVVLANLNHPRQSVISGSTPGVEAALMKLAAAGIKTTRLKVSHAFHSPLLSGVAEKLAPAALGLPLGTPRIPVVSSIRPGAYPEQTAGVREIFLSHATARVDFVGAVRAAAKLGARVFVQTGAGSALASMAWANLQDDDARPAATLTLSAATPDDGVTFLQALGQLFVLGVPVDLPALFTGRDTHLVALVPHSPLDTRAFWPISKKDSTAEPMAAVARTSTDPTKGAHHRNSNGSGNGIGSGSASGLSAAEGSLPPQPLVSMTMDNKPKSPTDAGAPDPSGLAALFQQQAAILEANLAIIRQQNELLLRAGVTSEPHMNGAALPNGNSARGTNIESRPTVPPRAPTAVMAKAPARAPIKNGAATNAPRVSVADCEARVIEVVARITAHPPARLKPTTRLGADLGFDSLMVVELVSGLQDQLPEAEPLPKSLFATDISIADVARHLSASTVPTARHRARTAHSGSGELSRYAVVLAPLPAPPGRKIRRGERFVLVTTEANLAAPLRARLESQGARVDVVAEEAEGRDATVIDLRGLQNDVIADPGAAARASVLRAFSLARHLDTGRPATLLFGHRGPSNLGIAGFSKALAREWEDAAVKAVELPGEASAEALAEILVREALTTDATPEIVCRGNQRLAPELRPADIAPGTLNIPTNAVVLISGGGHGLGVRLALDLARRIQARLVLLGRREKDAALDEAIDQIRVAGGDAIYVPCDVREAAAVKVAVALGRKAFGPIQVAVHAAGLLEDGPVGKKTRDGFSRVFDTKVAGALSLWNALTDEPLATFLSYGSWAGRFGNAHQVDYAAANHTLGRLAEIFAQQRPGVRVTTLDLPPWEGTGMLSSVPEAVQRQMAAQGVTFLNDELGLDRVVRELGATGLPSGEFILGADLPTHTRHAALHLHLSVKAQPWLDDHRVNGRAVLPMAAAVDHLVHAAQAAGVTSAAGNPVVVKDLVIDQGVVLHRDDAEILVRAQAEHRPEITPAATVELHAHTGRGDGKAFVAYRAEVSTTSEWFTPVNPPHAQGASLSLAEFYEKHTFHGPSLRAVEAIPALGEDSIAGLIRTGELGLDPHESWLLAVDGALQLCAYWAVVHHGKVGLPTGFAEMRLRGPIPTGTKLLCMAVLRKANGDRLEGDIDLKTEGGQPIVQIRGLQAELIELRQTDERPAFDTSTFHIEEFPEVKELNTKLSFAKAAGIEIPYFRTLDGSTGATALIDGKEFINFTSYNYLGLAGHPRLAAAVAEAARKYGTSVSASRVTGGQKPLHQQLEDGIARFLGCEASVVMVGGHATNVSVVGHIVGPEDMVLHDALAHDSILGGARLSGARRRPFPHNDVAALENILQEVRGSVRRVLIAIEGVYSMDGDMSPLPDIIEVKKKYGAMLFVDEAHSLGVVGKTGRGIGEHYGVDRRDVEMWMGTMSKSLSSCGGYIAGSAALCEFLKYTTPGFIYSVGMSPANAAAALAALEELENHPELATRCQDRSRYFLNLCRDRGVDTGPSEGSAVVPCIVGNSFACIRLAEGLLKRGIHVHPILYPAVPEAQARLRFFITAAHSEDQLRYTADAIADELAKLDAGPGTKVEKSHEKSVDKFVDSKGSPSQAH